MSINERRYFGFKRTKGDASRVDSASQGVPALIVPVTDRDMHFASAADEATDWNVSNPTHPTFYIHSETTPATDYISFDHDATDGTINVASGNLKLAISGTDVLTLTATALTPTTTDVGTLGTASLMWGDLFLASGAVINFDNGDVTLTHSANTLAIAGGDVTIASAVGLNVGSTTQLTVSDGDGTTNLIPEVQALGVGTAFAGGAIAIGTFNTTNDRTVSPKLAFVKGAAATQVATTAVADNEVVGSIIAYASDSADFETPVGAIEFVVDDAGAPGAGAIGGSIEFYTTADGGSVLTAAMTINTAQNLIIGDTNGIVIGYTAQVPAGAVTSEFQMHGTAPADSTALLAAWSADAVPPRLYFAKSRSATIGTFSIITSGDNLGEILAFGDDGVDFNSNGNASCGIIFDSSGTIAADRVPGQMLFQTATDAAPSVLTTAMTISNAQVVTMASTLTVQGTSATIGVAGTTVGSLILAGNTSGTVSLRAQAAAGTVVFLLPAVVGSNGDQLATDGNAGTATTSWTAAASLAEFKNIHGVVQPSDALSKVLSTPVYSFHYKEDARRSTKDFDTEYVGVLAEEAPWAMHYGGEVINPINSLGYTVLAIQALQQEINDLKSRLGE